MAKTNVKSATVNTTSEIEIVCASISQAAEMVKFLEAEKIDFSENGLTLEAVVTDKQLGVIQRKFLVLRGKDAANKGAQLVVNGINVTAQVVVSAAKITAGTFVVLVRAGAPALFDLLGIFSGAVATGATVAFNQAVTKGKEHGNAYLNGADYKELEDNAKKGYEATKKAASGVWGWVKNKTGAGGDSGVRVIK